MTDTPKTEVTLDKALRKYVEFRDQLEELERAHKVQTADIKSKMLTLETYITEQADAQGLANVKIAGVGTAMWTTLYKATVASRDAFISFVKTNDAFDLIENRANKTAVRAYIDAHGEPPPGVDFSQYRSFSVRKAGAKETAGDDE